MKPRGTMRLTPEMVARCFRAVQDPGPSAGLTPLVDDEVEALVESLIAARGGESVWVFAYGSLIWNPVVAPDATERALAPGWHRSFCMEITRWRGTPEAPGLMMALARGGSCVGLAQRLPRASQADDLQRLIVRELPWRELTHNVRWITVATARGRQPALAFWAAPRGEYISHGLPLDTVARRLARACGHGGSGAEYLYNTVAHLEAAGIRDRNLWRLQELVAKEVGSWTRPAG